MWKLKMTDKNAVNVIFQKKGPRTREYIQIIVDQMKTRKHTNSQIHMNRLQGTTEEVTVGQITNRVQVKGMT